MSGFRHFASTMMRTSRFARPRGFAAMALMLTVGVFGGADSLGAEDVQLAQAFASFYEVGLDTSHSVRVQNLVGNVFEHQPVGIAVRGIGETGRPELVVLIVDRHRNDVSTPFSGLENRAVAEVGEKHVSFL